MIFYLLLFYFYQSSKDAIIATPLFTQWSGSTFIGKKIDNIYYKIFE